MAGSLPFERGTAEAIGVGSDTKKLEKETAIRCCRIQTGIAKGPKKINDAINLPYLRVANVQDGFLDLSHIKKITLERSKVDRYLLQQGDVLLTEGGDFDKLGRGTVWDAQLENCVHQNHIFVARPNKDIILPEFLSLLTGSPYGKAYFLRCSKQSTNLASINSTQLKEFPVLLPPLSEQIAIADLLSTWDAAIEKTERLIAVKEARFSWLLSRLICCPNQQQEHIRDFTKEVSRRNREIKFGRVLSVTNHNGFVLPEDQFERRVASGDLSNYKVVTRGQYAYNPSRINVGSIARLKDWNKGVLSPMYVVFELNEKKVVSDFFLHWLSSHEAKERIRKSAQGSVRETVSFTDFGSIKFPFPSLEQQRDIASAFNIARYELNLLKKQLEAFRKQKRGLMQKLLTGQWRVKVVQ